MTLLSFNAGGAFGASEALHSFVLRITSEFPDWAVCFVQEHDFRQNHLVTVSFVEGHKVLRHWPGTGSRAMSFVVNRRFQQFVCNFEWRGRAGGLHLFNSSSNLPSIDALNIIAVGIHGGHGDDLGTSLFDSSFVIKKLKRRRAACADLVALGDLNVDLLPLQSFDPFCDYDERLHYDPSRHNLLHAWADQHNISVCEQPHQICGVPGGAWSEFCVGSPISRIPTGDQPGLPSLLDFVCCNPAVLFSSILCWDVHESDHALLCVTVKTRFRTSLRPKRIWSVVCEDTCIDNMHLLNLQQLKSISSVEVSLRGMQVSFGCSTTCKQRRVERMPLDLRTLYARKAIAASEDEKRGIIAEIRVRRKIWIQRLQYESRVRAIASGRVLRKSKRLHTIETVDNELQVLSDKQDCADAIAKAFSDKWGSNDLSLRSDLKRMLMMHEGTHFDLTTTEIADAFTCLRHKCRRDRNGITTKVYELLFIAQPEQFGEWLMGHLSCFSSMGSYTPTASVFGKTGSDVKTSGVRVIVPQLAFSQIVDVILCKKLQTFIDSQFPVTPYFFEAARPRTQQMDIISGVSLFIEKSLDMHSSGAVAQQDVRQHYDTLDCIRIFHWLVSHGFSAACAAACLRHQLLPSICITVSGFESFISDRCRGGLTGSRVAGQLGRVPIQATLRDLSCSLRKLAWSADGAVLVAASFVDNLYFLSNTTYKATKMGNLFAGHLRTAWGQDVKPDSKQVLAAVGAVNHALAATDWELCNNMKVLGHIVEDNGSITKDFNFVITKLWKAFWSNGGRLGSSKLSCRHRMVLVKRAATPILDQHASRWPFTLCRARQLDRIQRKMLSMCSVVRRDGDESDDEFYARRNRFARQLQESVGKWSHRWAKLVSSWYDHVERDPNYSWPSQLLPVRSVTELELRRSLWGRPRTRRRAGFLNARWTESVDTARNFIV